MSQVNALKNTDGIFVNTETLKEEANHFLKHGYYCPDPWGSPAWKQYWEEQLKRCQDGYSSGGLYITGNHYGYLNFAQIKLTKEFIDADQQIDESITDLSIVEMRKQARKSGKGAAKDVTFPSFWDSDYNYFHTIDIARWGATEEYLKGLGLEVEIMPDYLNGGYHLIVGKSRRKGYQQPHSEIICTPEGYVTMGELNVGDLVLNPDGRSTKVLEKYPHGKCDVYELVLRDGRTVKCGLDHLWEIVDSRGNKRTVNTEFFLNKQLIRNKGKSNQYHSYFIENTKSVKYKKQPLTVDPYVLGILLGDGALTQHTVMFSSDDEFIVNEMKVLTNMPIVETGAKFQYRINGKGRRNPLYQELDKLGVCVNALQKHIPEIYKFSSIKQRMSLIQGLMDSDGSSSSNGAARFTSSSEQLIDDLLEILYSLGIRTKKAKVKGQGFSTRDYFIISITTDKQIFRLPRKLSNIRTNRKYKFNHIPIISVTKLNYQEESSCILVDNPNHLYLTKDYIVTHNSYKNGWIAANNYNCIENSVTIIGAFDKKYLYPEGTMKMANDYVNFFNEHTGWAKARDFVNSIHHKKASYEERDENNISVEKGFKSTIMALSFGDNPDAAIGKDGTLVEFEEAGKFPNLKESYMKTKPAMEDGIYTTGQIFVFGTGGSMDNATTDFAEMFYNPIPYKLLPFKNIWDVNVSETSKCGFFVPDFWNKPGFIDGDGNSNKKAARDYEEEKRKMIIKESSGNEALNEYIQQYPFNPAESFLVSNDNEFPVEELKMRLATVIEQNLHVTKTQPVTLYRDPDTGKAAMRPDLKNKLQPVIYHPPKTKNKTGAVVILEPPIENPPIGLYKAGYDPYRHDQSSGPSLGALYVYKSANSFSYTRDQIVAWYIARPATSDLFNDNAILLAELYNLEIMHENEVTEVKSYFGKRKKLHLLASQPDAVISKNIKNSTVSRIYGIHMAEKLKDAGEKYIKMWLLTERDRDENGKILLNLDTITDVGLLQELIIYNRKDNFDRVMAFMMVMFQIEEDEEGKNYNRSAITKVAQQLEELKLFTR